MSTMLNHEGSVSELLADLLARRHPRPKLVNDRGNVVGQDHHRSRLSDHDVWLIHELRAAGVKRRVIAEKMEVSFYTVCEILTGRRRTMIATGQRSGRRTP